MAPTRRPDAPSRRLDPSDPAWKSVELVQRGHLILDVAEADLEAAVAALGPFHPTAWHFRAARDEARRSWDRLRAEYGQAALEAALAEPPAAVLRLGGDQPGQPALILITIGGRTYRVEPIAGPEPAPVQWRLTRLPALEDGPYYVCRLRDGSTQCDCAEWIYQIDGHVPGGRCKHLAALAELGWL
jgi:hypothetical protein